MEKSGIRTHRKQQIRRTRGAGYEAAQDFESAVSVPLRCKWDANRYKKRQVGEVKAWSKVQSLSYVLWAKLIMTVGLRAGAKMNLGSSLRIVSIGIKGGTGLGYFFRVQYQPRKKGHDNRICRARGNVSGYNELRNVNSSCFSDSVSSRKCRVTCSASSLCRSMAFSSVKDRRSCM
jgi:hypothetical protein